MQIATQMKFNRNALKKNKIMEINCLLYDSNDFYYTPLFTSNHTRKIGVWNFSWHYSYLLSDFWRGFPLKYSLENFEGLDSKI